MQLPDDEPIWELLNSASQIHAPACFTNNVLRQIRLENSDSHELHFLGWLRQSWRLITGLSVVAALLVSMIFLQENLPSEYAMAFSDKPELSTLIASVSMRDLNEFGEMDISIDDNDLWLDTLSY